MKKYLGVFLFYKYRIYRMKITPNYAKIIQCINCNFKCCKNSDWERHIATAKHKIRTNSNNLEQNTPQNAEFMFTCKKCSRGYNARNSLWYHEKKCVINNDNYNDNYNDNVNNSTNDNIILTNMVLEVVKQNKELITQNQEFKNLILEIAKKDTITNTNINSHNKTFNLQLFLNETCKDAMNIMDFVDSIKLQLVDLEKVGKIGYVEGISNIIVKNLNSLDETKRPVHCTDSKREVMYVKDENKWERENENKQKIRKAIKCVAHKNSKLLNDFRDKHPDCIKSNSRFSDQYNKLVVEALGGKGDNDLEKEDKIIKNISKEVSIDKS